MARTKTNTKNIIKHAKQQDMSKNRIIFGKRTLVMCDLLKLKFEYNILILI